jgi:hypothetical protein
LGDFLKHAQRIPVAFSWDDDGREIPAEDSELSDANKRMHGKPLFDIDATILLNELFPLDIWRQAAASSMLAPHLRRDVAQAAWLRAVLLDDLATADVLARTVSSQIPELATNMDEYIQARQPDAKRFSAIYTWLKFPGLEPVVDAGLGRQESLGVQDTYRDNWWCTATYIRGQPELEQTGVERLKITSPIDLIHSGKLPPFLTSTQAATGQSQWAKLKTIGAAPNFLCREVIRWTSKSPGDPRIPEALHLAVRSTRYGCTNQETARWSKAAFDLLHKRFPTSIWAKRTPYWFKD